MAHRVGHWVRQAGCAFSQSCAECRDTDTLQAALRRQRDRAGTTAVQPRRIVASFNGDMKGLMQIAGMSSQGVYNCIFCLHQKNATSVGGIPCLRHPPEGPWTAAHLARPVEVRDPPPRPGTDAMAVLAANYQRDAAAHKGSTKLFPNTVERFMVRHTEVYPDEQPTPKMHVLGFHYVEMMERHGSTGIDSEQGIEALHPEYNYVLNHFRALDRNKPAQLEAVVGRMWSRNGGATELKADSLRAQLQSKNERSRERSKRKAY